MICKKCGTEMLDEFENNRGSVTIKWFCPECDDDGHDDDNKEGK